MNQHNITLRFSPTDASAKQGSFVCHPPCVIISQGKVCGLASTFVQKSYAGFYCFIIIFQKNQSILEWLTFLPMKTQDFKFERGRSKHLCSLDLVEPQILPKNGQICFSLPEQWSG